jgi:hypothetical protein
MSLQDDKDITYISMQAHLLCDAHVRTARLWRVVPAS